MPAIRRRVAATTADALSNIKFSDVPEPGAVINLWAAGVTATDDIGLAVGSQEYLQQGTDINIEISADVLDNTRDQLLFNEVIPAGHIFVPVTVTTEMQFLLTLAYIGG